MPRIIHLDAATRRAIADCKRHPAMEPLKVGPLPSKGVPEPGDEDSMFWGSERLIKPKHVMSLVVGVGTAQLQCSCGWLGDRYMTMSVRGAECAIEQANHHCAGLTECAPRRPVRLVPDAPQA